MPISTEYTNSCMCMCIQRVQNNKGCIFIKLIFFFFLLKETLLVAEVSEGTHSKFRERRVFLFEQIIIFSEVIEEKKKGSFYNANYIYKNTVKVSFISFF